MNSSEYLRIDKQQASATVQLVGGRRLSGTFYLSVKSRLRLGPETVQELLSDHDTPWVPFRDLENEDVYLLHKQRIVFLELEAGEHTEHVRGAPDAHFHEATLHHADGELVGGIYTGDMHPDQQRPVDVLNHGADFLFVRSGDTVYLVNSRLIHFVRPD